jgi:hypothetical protein
MPASIASAARNGDRTIATPSYSSSAFTFSPIMHHEKPSAHSLFGGVQRVASNSLLNL